MTVVSILLTSLALQGAAAKDLRTVDVKAAGLSVSVPKAWSQNKAEGNLSASLNIPIPDSKLLGKMEIGYVNDESKDVDDFLSASKTVLTVGGNTVERQWKVDIMTSPLALSRYSKGPITTVRGVLFRSFKSKFVISISSPTEVFEKVEPYLLSTLESMKEVRIVTPKEPTVAQEKKIMISRPSPKKGERTVSRVGVTLGTKQLFVNLPKGSTVLKTDGTTLTCSVAGLTNPVVVTVFSTEGNPPSLVFQTKAAESSKLFAGAVQRIDQTSTNHADRQVRDFIWRTGVAAKNGAPLMAAICVTTQPANYFLSSIYQSEGAFVFAKDRTLLTKFFTAMSLTDR